MSNNMRIYNILGKYLKPKMDRYQRNTIFSDFNKYVQHANSILALYMKNLAFLVNYGYSETCTKNYRVYTFIYKARSYFCAYLF